MANLVAKHVNRMKAHPIKCTCRIDSLFYWMMILIDAGRLPEPVKS
ncbi:MAG: hypothetical protein ACTSWN_03600 [Promethearchaeota archaeon]